jgi:hypothetical protein
LVSSSELLESRIPNSYDGSPTGGRTTLQANNNNSAFAPVLLQSTQPGLASINQGSTNRGPARLADLHDDGSYNSHPQENLSL